MSPECQRVIEIQDIILKWENRGVTIYRCELIWWIGFSIVNIIQDWATDSKYWALFLGTYLSVVACYSWMLYRSLRRRRIAKQIRANFIQLDAAANEGNAIKACHAAEQLDAFYRDL